MAWTQGPDLAPNPMPSAVAGPPLEEHLAQNTLWPEVFKLYGHANHIFSMAADPQGIWLASACKVQPACSHAWLCLLMEPGDLLCRGLLHSAGKADSSRPEDLCSVHAHAKKAFKVATAGGLGYRQA